MSRSTERSAMLMRQFFACHDPRGDVRTRLAAAYDHGFRLEGDVKTSDPQETKVRILMQLKVFEELNDLLERRKGERIDRDNGGQR